MSGTAGDQKKTEPEGCGTTVLTLGFLAEPWPLAVEVWWPRERALRIALRDVSSMAATQVSAVLSVCVVVCEGKGGGGGGVGGESVLVHTIMQGCAVLVAACVGFFVGFPHTKSLID